MKKQTDGQAVSLFFDTVRKQREGRFYSSTLFYISGVSMNDVIYPELVEGEPLWRKTKI